MDYIAHDTKLGKNLRGLPPYFLPLIDLSLLFIATNSSPMVGMFPNAWQRNIVASFIYVYYQSLITNKSNPHDKHHGSKNSNSDDSDDPSDAATLVELII